MELEPPFRTFFLFRTDRDHEIKLNDVIVFEYLEETCGTRNALVTTAHGLPASGKTRALNQILNQWHQLYCPAASTTPAPLIPDFRNDHQNEGVLIAVYNLPGAPVPLVCLDVCQSQGRNQKLYLRLLKFCFSVSNAVVFTYLLGADTAKIYPSWIPERIPTGIVALGFIWTRYSGEPRTHPAFSPGKSLPYEEEVRVLADLIYKANGKPFLYQEQILGGQKAFVAEKLIEAFIRNPAFLILPQETLSNRILTKVSQFGGGVGSMHESQMGFLIPVSLGPQPLVLPVIPTPQARFDRNQSLPSSTGNWRATTQNNWRSPSKLTEAGTPVGTRGYAPSPVLIVQPTTRTTDFERDNDSSSMLKKIAQEFEKRDPPAQPTRFPPKVLSDTTSSGTKTSDPSEKFQKDQSLAHTFKKLVVASNSEVPSGQVADPPCSREIPKSASEGTNSSEQIFRIQKNLWVSQLRNHSADLHDLVKQELQTWQVQQLSTFGLIAQDEITYMVTIAGAIPEEKSRLFMQFLAAKQPPYKPLLDKLAKVFDNPIAPKMSNIFKGMRNLFDDVFDGNADK